MTDNKIYELLQKTLQASKERKIDWEKSPKHETSYKAQLGKSLLYIIEVGHMDKAFVILNESGDEIGRYSGYAYELDQLYDLAKAKALKIDESLDEIDDLLDSML